MDDFDITKPVTNNKVRDLLEKRARIADAASQEMSDCMNELLDEIAFHARFLTVTSMTGGGIRREEDGNATILKDTVISFEGINDVNGNHFIVAYTDWESLRRDPRHPDDDVETVVLSFDDYCLMVKNNCSGIAINPFSDNYVMPKELIQHVKEIKEMQQSGHCEKVVQKDTKVQVGEPAEYPVQMIDAISKAAKTDRRVNAIHLKLMVNGDEKSYLLIVDFNGDRNEVFGLLANAGKPFLPEGMYLDIVPISDNSWKKVADNKRFYRKKLFG